MSHSADSEQQACCAPMGRSHLVDGAVAGQHDGHGPDSPGHTVHHHDGPGHGIEQAAIPEQTFRMGDSLGDAKWGDGETPVHAVHVPAFEIDVTSVTNDAFARFVGATGYHTEAETFGYSAVFHLALEADDVDILGQPPETPWWFGVRGADWRHPGGPKSSLVGKGDHPVVHVSWNDARAYSEWAGRELPTEAQWEAASRGGLDGARFPWGNDLGTGEGSGGPWRVNIFQGTFPSENTTEDGFLTTAPVRSFTPNGYGVWQTVGNVWEWCRDVWAEETYANDLLAAGESGVTPSPSGPEPTGPDDVRIMRGGSYLCHDSYCNRYRNSARSSNTPDSSMGNAGFRTVSR